MNSLLALSTDEQRAAVVKEAREWVATPYHHAADVKGAGVDCALLIVRVFVDLGLTEPFDPRPYPPDWMLHRSEERYLNWLLSRARPVKRAGPGDVMLLRFGRCYAHGMIVTRAEPLTVVHAYLPHRYVVEEQILHSPNLAARARRAACASLWPHED